MKKTLIVLNLILILIFVISYCSSDKNPLPSVSHPEGWNITTSDDFHGTKVLESGYVSCKSCHGTELKGGKTKESCFDCHQTYPHPDEWGQINMSNNHAAFIEAQSDSINYCKSCHGQDLLGGRSGVSCYICHAEGTLP